MTDTEAERLKQWVKSSPQEAEEFTDIEGSLIIQPERIEAVGINKAAEMREIGY